LDPKQSTKIYINKYSPFSKKVKHLPATNESRVLFRIQAYLCPSAVL